jgi:hypothetical protein
MKTLTFFLAGLAVTASAQTPSKSAPPAVKTPAAPAAASPAPKKELAELSLKLVGTAYPEVEFKSSALPLAPGDVKKELQALKVKLSYRPLLVQSFRKNPAGVPALGDVEAFVMRPHDMYLISRDYNVVMSADPGERCYGEVQVVVLRTSPISRLDQIAGKTVGLLESKPAYQFVTENPLRAKEYLHTEDSSRLVQMLKSNQVAALVTNTYKIGTQTISPTSIGVWNGTETKAHPEVKVIHVTDTKVPCYVVALRRGSSPEGLARLAAYGARDAEKAKALLLAIGGFSSLTPITQEQWTKLRDRYVRYPAYGDFLSGKVRPPGFRKLK